ncbi:MAG TPA: biopolymer transporter ExbD [Planctomycetota bacterium]|nr:biopolymer transporter ExbD [Planctomycetota bacterium]
MLKIKSKPEEGERINMTPMIDVVFQLLIFFMLCTDLATKESLELTLPRVTEAVPDEGEAGRQTINIDKAGKVYVGKYPVTLDELEKVIKIEASIHQSRRENVSEKPILIRADSDSQFGVIQEIMQLCVKHKVYKLSFAAKIGVTESTTSLKGGTN